MKFEEIAHLYLKVEVIVGGTELPIKVTCSIHGCFTETLEMIPIENVKPLLTPLSKMTKEDEDMVAALCFGNDDFIITYRGNGYEGQKIHDSVRCLKLETFCNHPDIKNWIPAALVQIDNDKDMPIIMGRFSDNGKELTDDLIEKPFKLTTFLLSKGYDLFNLIPSGEALDKTEVEKGMKSNKSS